MIRASGLVGLAVVTLSDATKVGQVADVLVDPELGHVLGFRLGAGPFQPADAVARAEVAAVGRDAVTILDAAAVNQESRLPALAPATTLGQATGTKVVSEGGDFVGTIADVELDEDARAVTGFVLAGKVWERLRHQQPVISAQRQVRLGGDGIMVVPRDVAERLRPSA